MKKEAQKEAQKPLLPQDHPDRVFDFDDHRDREYYMSLRTWERNVELGKAYPFPGN